MKNNKEVIIKRKLYRLISEIYYDIFPPNNGNNYQPDDLNLEIQRLFEKKKQK